MNMQKQERNASAPKTIPNSMKVGLYLYMTPGAALVRSDTPLIQ